MDSRNRPDLVGFLKTLPPVEFCSVYGSSLHKNFDKTSMIDLILGVANPRQWHAKNLEMNQDHYASWMFRLGGARLITEVADDIGVGVHFNPYVLHKDWMFKYGVVRMHDLIGDIMNWERFYISGRLQKPVDVIVDNVDIINLNALNLSYATAAALLLSPSSFNEEELYAKICSLSYMGDLRMIFAEDRDKVTKIVRSQLQSFKKMYEPKLEEYAEQNLIRISYDANRRVNINQDCGSSTTSSLVANLPMQIRKQMFIGLEEKNMFNTSGLIASRTGAAKCMQKVLRRKVMVSSARQAVAGLLTAGVVNGFRYLGSKMQKAWKSWQ